MAVEQVTPGSTKAALYAWQKWVHVGADRDDECVRTIEATGVSECDNPLHFHAWVRLPNPHQHRDIRDKAMAAKARRMRMMRDPQADMSVIVEEEIETLARRGEAVRGELIEQLVGQEWWKWVLQAQRDVQWEREDPDDDESPLRWEHIDEDIVRLREIRAMHEDEQPKDERRMLEERARAHEQALEAARKEAEQPLRDELSELDISALLDRVRDARIQAEGSNYFEATFNEWEMVTCTYRQVPEPGQPGERYWRTPAELEFTPEPVTTEVRRAFDELNRDKGGLAQGNS